MGRAFPALVSAGTAGIASVASFSDLAALAPTVGDQRFVEDEGEVRTYCAVGGGGGI